MPAVQKYRKAWEQLPELSDWLCEIPEEPVRAYCNVCKIKLQAHKSSLLDHKKTARHMYGEQKLSDPLQIAQSDILHTSHMLDSFPDAVNHFIAETKEHTGLSPIKKELPVAQRSSLIWKHFTKLSKTESFL
ncbi:hypothetical protein Avbf_01347 [Armadillidium vulgare]|nr:hypothetical protein Avbf_01347 [Armadillidium vulgare]